VAAEDVPHATVRADVLIFSICASRSVHKYVSADLVFSWSDSPDLVRSTSVPRVHVLADEPMVLEISLEGNILVSRLLRQGGFF